MPTNFGVKDVLALVEPTRKAEDYAGHVAINVDTNKFVGRGDYRILCVRTWLSHPKSPIYFTPIKREKGYAELGEFALRALYRNTTGKDVTAFGREALEKAIMELALTLPIDPPLTEAEETLADKHTEALFPPKTWGPKNDPVHPLITRSQGQPKVARGPSLPGARPAQGTATGRVWDIADAELAKVSPADLGTKELRSAILAACVASGINQATAQVQYGKWKGSKSSS